MKRQKHRMMSLLAAGLLAAVAVLPAAADSAVYLEAVPNQTDITTGDNVTLSIQCAEADLDPASIALVFQVADGYVFTSAEAGSGITGGELSYSYQNGQLVLLYLDTAGGGSPVAPGQEIATVTLQAAEAVDGAPLICTEVDSSAVDAGGNVVGQAGTLDVGTVTVTGEAVTLPTAPPSIVEEGQTTDPESVSQDSNASSTNSALQQAVGQKNQSSDSAPQQSQLGNSQGTATDSAPTPTPYFTTTPDGERVQIMPDITPEPIDRTEEVLAGQPATTPVPTAAPAVTSDGAQAMLIWAIALLGVLVVVALILGVVKSRSKKL